MLKSSVTHSFLADCSTASFRYSSIFYQIQVCFYQRTTDFMLFAKISVFTRLDQFLKGNSNSLFWNINIFGYKFKEGNSFQFFRSTEFKMNSLLHRPVVLTRFFFLFLDNLLFSHFITVWYIEIFSDSFIPYRLFYCNLVLFI